jgi:hypothetical protein
VPGHGTLARVSHHALEPVPDVTFTPAATGDVLTTMPVNASARTSDGYDVSPILASPVPTGPVPVVVPRTSAADVPVA